MSHKEKVRLVYPRAYAEHFSTHGGGGYTLIWKEYRQSGRIGEHKTQPGAWKDALEHIRDRRLNVVEAEPARNGADEMCGLCDGKYEHAHPRSKCLLCGAEGLAENLENHVCPKLPKKITKKSSATKA